MASVHIEGEEPGALLDTSEVQRLLPGRAPDLFDVPVRAGIDTELKHAPAMRHHSLIATRQRVVGLVLLLDRDAFCVGKESARILRDARPGC